MAHNESFAESVENEAANVTLSGVKAGFRKGVVLSRGGVQSSTDPGIGMTRQIIESAKKIRLGIPQDRWGRLESVKVDEGEARAIESAVLSVETSHSRTPSVTSTKYLYLHVHVQVFQESSLEQR